MSTDTNRPNIPAWFNTEKISHTLDAREMLQRGEHPLSKVLQDTQEMANGSIYKLITSFVPIPLIEKVKATGLESYNLQLENSEVHTYFYKP
jgi:hypothetical protein